MAELTKHQKEIKARAIWLTRQGCGVHAIFQYPNPYYGMSKLPPDAFPGNNVKDKYIISKKKSGFSDEDRRYYIVEEVEKMFVGDFVGLLCYTGLNKFGDPKNRLKFYAVDVDKEEDVERIKKAFGDDLVDCLQEKGTKGIHLCFFCGADLKELGADKTGFGDIQGISSTGTPTIIFMAPSRSHKKEVYYMELKQINNVGEISRERINEIYDDLGLPSLMEIDDAGEKEYLASHKSMNPIIQSIKERIKPENIDPRLKDYIDPKTGKGSNKLCIFHEDCIKEGGAGLSLKMTSNGLMGKCFSTNLGHGSGNCFSMYMTLHNCDFKTALYDLAKIAGVAINEKNKSKSMKIPGAFYFLDQFGAAFIRLERAGHFEIWPVRGREFRRIAITALLDADERPSSEHIRELQDISEAKAYSSGKIYPLYVRCAKGEDGAFYIDLCDDDWRVARITSQGWEIIKEPPILFRRYSHMKSLEVLPGKDSDWKEYIDSLNLSDDNDKIILTGYVGTALVPGIPHPIPIPTGPQGSAKSSLCEAVRILVDNSELLTLSLPRDNGELNQQLSHHYMPIYDNVRELSHGQQDALCRGSTGEGISKRELYSDDGDVVYKYKRAIIINGINCPGQNPDYLDRSILLHLERIPKTKRKRKEVVEKEQLKRAPKVRGYLFDTLVKALQLLPEVPDTNLPRMADFAYYGEAFCRAAGHGQGKFLEVYNTNIGQQHEEAISGSLVGSVVQLFANDKKDWTGSPTEFYQELGKFAETNKINTHDRAWPKNANVLSRKLNILRTTLLELGIDVQITKSGTRNVRIIASSPSNASNTDDVDKGRKGDKDDIIRTKGSASQLSNPKNQGNSIRPGQEAAKKPPKQPLSAKKELNMNEIPDLDESAGNAGNDILSDEAKKSKTNEEDGL